MVPSELVDELPNASCVLVDEAAALPIPLLRRLLARYSRIVFATTVHGYEGTGRGFAIRFRAHLDDRAPDWRQLKMTTPIRWAPGSPSNRRGHFELAPIGCAVVEMRPKSNREPPPCSFISVDGRREYDTRVARQQTPQEGNRQSGRLINQDAGRVWEFID